MVSSIVIEIVCPDWTAVIIPVGEVPPPQGDAFCGLPCASCR